MKQIYETVKKYWPIVLIVPYLGLSTYFEGLRPVFQFQMTAYATTAEAELQSVACIQIVAGYVQAKNAQDQPMIDYWIRLAQQYQCQLPPV